MDLFKKLWHIPLTALLSAALTIIALRAAGYLIMPDTVNFSGDGHSDANSYKIQQIWDSLTGGYAEPVDEALMLDSAADAMAESVGDAYTTYYTYDEMLSYTQYSAGTYVGVGINVLAQSDGRLIVTGFSENSPASEAGMLKDDVIVGVDGSDALDIGDPDRVIDMIKGAAGTTVTLGIERDSETDYERLELVIERRELKTENIFSRAISADRTDGTKTTVAYIRIAMFDGSSAEYFTRHFEALRDQGVSALIIDLRGNPGGDYVQAVKIADAIMGEGVIVYTEDRGGEREYRNSDAASVGMPVYVLINQNSASASEILAGAVKDSGAGTVIGTRSFGKGLVQSVLTLADGSGLKYTSSKFYTPSGTSIQGVGIEPAVTVELPDGYKDRQPQDIPEAEDTQLAAALSRITR